MKIDKYSPTLPLQAPRDGHIRNSVTKCELWNKLGLATYETTKWSQTWCKQGTAIINAIEWCDCIVTLLGSI